MLLKDQDIDDFEVKEEEQDEYDDDYDQQEEDKFDINALKKEI